MQPEEERRAPAPAAKVLTGRDLGGFMIREQVGAGGFGDVYRAEQVALHREAVVKVLRPDAMTEDRVERFLREARLASRLDHPFAAHIYAFGTEADGLFWIAMERVRGASLGAMLHTQGPMPLDRFVPFFERICEVVQTAHEQGIIHRDLKPDNVMVISRAGRLLPKLLDFGIARAIGDDALASRAPDASELDEPVGTTTRRGAVLGSPPYMAPELWTDPHSAGPAADQYALAALAYEALTGRVAFTGRTVLDVARAHAKTKHEPLGAAFPEQLERVFHRALAKRAPDRFANVLELAQAFRAACGLGAATDDLPQLDEEIRTAFLTRGPQPLADAVAGFGAARNAHQGREALRTIARVASRYAGLLALACRSRAGSGGAGDSEYALSLLRDLRRNGLTPAAWVSLAKQLTLPFARLPDTFPIPELVLLLHTPAATDAFAPVLEGSLAEPLRDSSDDAAGQAIAGELPAVEALLRALQFTFDYELVVPDAEGANAWMGVSGRTELRRRVRLPRAMPAGQPVIVDASGGPVLVVWPLMQVHVAVPGHSEQLFLLDGPARAGARLISTQGFEHGDPDLWEWFRVHLLEADDGAAVATAADQPYRGLAAFTRDDAGWFFGREREAEVLLNRLRVEPFVAVVGPSGVGKSSFVHAGVAPMLTDYTIVTLRPGRAPTERLLAHLGALGLALAAGASDDAIAASLRAFATDRGALLIVVDQFEELFTLCASANERERFVALLLAAASTADGPIRVVITLRDDFLIRAEQLPGIAAVLARGLQLLGPLGAAALERILLEPLARVGYTFEDPALPARMVAEVADAPAAVALLSFTAARLWELRDRHFHQLPRKAYDALGGVGGALARHADDTVEALPARERSLVRRAFRHLVTFEGTRAVLDRDDLEQLLGGEAEATRVVERLVDARLLALGEHEGGGATVEIVHEALIEAWPRLVEWRREDLEGSRFHEQLRAAARQWQDRGRSRGLLWRDDALAEFVLWRKRHAANLTPLEATFGDASVAAANRGRRVRRIAIGTAVAIAAVFVWMLWRANRAEEQSRRSAETMLRDSYFEQGRLLVLSGDKLRATEPLAAAARMGDRGEAIRLLQEEASRTTRARLGTFAGHTEKLWTIAASPDGAHVVTGSADGTARIWDVATQAAIGVVQHGQPVLSVAFTPDGRWAVSGGRDQIVRRFDVTARVAGATLDAGWPISDVLTSPDGRSVLAIGLDGAVTAWDFATGAVLAQLTGHRKGVRAAFSRSGRWLVTWDETGVVAIWDARTWAQHGRHKSATGIRGGAIDPNETVIAIGTVDGGLELLGLDGTPVGRVHAHDQLIYAVAFSPDGATIATGSDDDTAKLWSVPGLGLRAKLEGHRANITAIRFANKRDLVATASADGTIRLWSAATGVGLGELQGHTNIVFDLEFLADDRRLVTASWDHSAIEWDVEAARQFRAVATAKVATTRSAETMAFDHAGGRIASIAPDQTMAVSDIRGERVICRTPAGDAVERIVWSNDDRAIATIAAGDTVVLRSPDRCTIDRELRSPDPVSAIGFDRSGRLLTGGDRTVRVWNADAARIDQTFTDLPGPVDRIGVSPDGELYAVTGSPVPAVVILGAGAPVVLRAGAMALTAVEFDPSRRRVLASSLDQHVWIWDRATGRVVDKLEGSGPLWAVRLAPDGASLVGVGGVAPRVWRSAGGAPAGALEGHADLVVGGAFVTNDLFATASRDGTARVWDMKTRKPILAFEGAQTLAINDDRSIVVFADVGGAWAWSPRLRPASTDER